MPNDDIPDLPESASLSKSFWEKFWHLTESNFFMGGGLGMVLAAYAFLIGGASKFSIFLLLIAWVISTVAVYRHGFFERKSNSVQVTSHILISVCLAIVFIVAWFVLRPKMEGSSDAAIVTKPLEIVYDLKEHDLSFDNFYRGESVHHHAFCISICNRSEQTVRGIQVKLDHVEPELPKFHQLLLHQHGDNPPTFDDYEHWDKYQRDFTLTSQGKQIIDAVFTDSRYPATGLVQHITGSVSKEFPPDIEYTLFITVSAEGVTPFTEMFKTHYDSKTRILTFWPYQRIGAEDQISVTKNNTEALINAERANISFERITVHGIREIVEKGAPEGIIQITYRMRNDGKKPAYTRNITFQAKVTPKNCLPMPLVFDNPTTTEERYTIYPGTPFDTFDKFDIQNFKVTLKQAKDILAGKQFLFVFGFVEYDDIFEQPRKYDFAIYYKFNHSEGKTGDDADLRVPIKVQMVKISCDDRAS